MNPLTRDKLRIFRHNRRAWFSLILLTALYLVSLGSELICNNQPLWLIHNGTLHLPLFRFYPEDHFLDNGRMTRPNYKALREDPRFAAREGNRMVFPLVPFGPREVIRSETLEPYRTVSIRLRPDHAVGRMNLTRQGTVVRPVAMKPFLPVAEESAEAVIPAEYWHWPEELAEAIKRRFSNRKAPEFVLRLQKRERPEQTAYVMLPVFTPRESPPRTVRVAWRETPGDAVSPVSFTVRRDGRVRPRRAWRSLPEELRPELLNLAGQAFTDSLIETSTNWQDRRVAVTAARNEISFPHRPVPGHPMGLDASGRDVLTLMLYGMRIAMSFGILLVITATLLGTLLGALQGYFCGWVDILGQRFMEIWAAPPFLYVMILAGAILGRGFLLFLVCYGLFNWLGISYYMRAEFLRLRNRPFVDAARCQGCGHMRIMLKHILPNALTPLITLFPFQLIGAIGALAALDYLGFGLPPMTPSWGQLLAQAQQYRWAWWLILYPSLGLFAVILLTAFVGEGLRNAFDPKPFTKIE